VNYLATNTSQALPAVDPDAYFPFGTIQASQPQNTQGVLSINFNNEVVNNGGSQCIQMNGSGGPILLKFGEDIPLDSEDYIGKNGYYTFQISVNCWNDLYSNTTVSFNVGRPEGLQLDAFPKIKYPKAHELMRGAGLQAGSLLGSIFDVIREIPIVGDFVGSFLPSDKRQTTEQTTDQGQGQVMDTGIAPVPSNTLMTKVRGAKKLGAGVGRWRKYIV
jgi:hypothetical protein